ncbi:MAG: hypothetical protein R6V12_12675, partial [Candidatus Hydrogenedentota bacterium]
QEDRSLRVARQGEKIQTDSQEAGEAESIDVSVWDLLEAFGRVLEATGQTATTVELTTDDTPQEVVMQRIMNRFQSSEQGSPREEVPLGEFVEHGANRAVIISLILAILELVKLGRDRRVAGTDTPRDNHEYLGAFQ